MMDDLAKTKDQLLYELKDLRQRVSELEELEEKLRMMKFSADQANEFNCSFRRAAPLAKKNGQSDHERNITDHRRARRDRRERKF